MVSMGMSVFSYFGGLTLRQGLRNIQLSVEEARSPLLLAQLGRLPNSGRSLTLSRA